MTDASAPLQQQLSDLFGSYKAEWLREQIFDLFTKPAYFPELLTPRPCVLVGGRGTGKTTVLRSLSYEGQFALSDRDPDTIASWPYYGLYYRVDTNRVTAFCGPELTPERWARVFGHYVNLIACDLLLRFLEWYELRRPDCPSLDASAIARIAASFQLSDAQNTRDLSDRLDLARLRFEAEVNNVADGLPTPLSMQGAPIQILTESILELPQFHGKMFFFLIDEYENLQDYQQQTINTLIKHSGYAYTFKIGVRELGWRVRTTLNANEQLISPADYVRITISDSVTGSAFKTFAETVCNNRLSRLSSSVSPKPLEVAEAFLDLSEDQEAILLGIEPLAEDIRMELSRIPAIAQEDFANLSPLELYFLRFWSLGQSESLEDAFRTSQADGSKWRASFNNYKHALLYTLRPRKTGIRKHYAGWSVFVQLAGSNIRYLLELVERSFLLHIEEGGHLGIAVPPERQTRAAQRVGRKNLSELQGLSVHGAQLVKLLLGLGRVFEVMAQDAAGHAPEINQFHVTSHGADSVASEDEAEATKAAALLTSAVMHLALTRFPGSKLADESSTREYDYSMHPIYSAFFVCSYRQKRKMALTARDLVGLVESPKETIRSILKRHRRSVDEPLPDQLQLFEGYYRDRA